MPRLSLLRPLDQPTSARRLLHDLEAALDDDRFTGFRLIVAYAKSGPLLHLHPRLTDWRRAGKTVEAVLGIDQRGTSMEALRLALDLFDRTYVTHQHAITFHPKLYLFTGPEHARAFVGSNNLTVGGTETNYEAAIARVTDPIVNVAVYGAARSLALTLNYYRLNTVYYEKKREIRITAAPLASIVPDYSIMILERSYDEGVDYEITVHRPDSPDHRIWLARCDQRMPGGGRAARRF